MKLKGVSHVQHIYNATQCSALLSEEIMDTITHSTKRVIQFAQRQFKITLDQAARIQVQEELRKKFQISQAKRFWIKETGYHLGREKRILRPNPNPVLSKKAKTAVESDIDLGYVDPEVDDEEEQEEDVFRRPEVTFSPILRTFPFGYKPDPREQDWDEYINDMLSLKLPKP